MRQLTLFRTSSGTWQCVAGVPGRRIDQLVQVLPDFEQLEDAQHWALYHAGFLEHFERHLRYHHLKCTDDCLEVLTARTLRRRLSKYRTLCEREHVGQRDKTAAASLRFHAEEGVPHPEVPGLVSQPYTAV